MTLQPFIDAGWVIQIHAVSATIALGLGPLAIYRRKRDLVHKVSGYIWVVAMAVTALSSFWIHDFAIVWILSPIHALSVLALWSLYIGMRHILQGRVAQHRAVFRSLYWNGVLIAGLFNFLPGRVVNRIFFDEYRTAGVYVIMIGATLLGLRLVRQFGQRKSMQPA